MFRDTNSPPTLVSISQTPGASFIEAERTGDATHAAFFIREDSSTPWSGNVEVFPVGIFQAKGDPVPAGPGSKRPDYVDITELASMRGFVPGPSLAAPQIIASRTGPLPAPAAIALVPFGPFDRVRLMMRATAAAEVAYWSCAVLNLALSFDETILSSIDAINSLVFAGLDGSDRFMSIDGSIEVEEGDETPVYLNFTGDFSGSITGDSGITALVTLVEDGGDLADGSAYTLQAGDPGTTVVAVGASAKGVYMVSPDPSAGVAIVTVVDVVGGTTQDIIFTAGLMSTGSTGLAIDAYNNVFSGTVSFTPA